MSKFIKLIGNMHLNGHSVAAYDLGGGVVALRHEKNNKETGMACRCTREFFDDELDGYTGVKVLTEALKLCGVDY